MTQRNRKKERKYMFQVRIATSGFLQCIKKHKNFTAVLIISYVMLVFFLSLFYQMRSNVKHFWVDSIIGGNIITTENNDFLDFYTPTALENSFSYDSFLKKQKNKYFFAPRIRTQALIEKKQSLPVIIIGAEQAKEDYNKPRNRTAG
jgi:hypothetical protein